MDPAVLRRAPLFTELSDSQLGAILGIARTETYKAGDSIFKEGDPGDRLFVIAEGAVRISRHVPGAGEEALAVLEAGGCFGEMAVFDRPDRSTDAIANRACTLLSIAQPDLDLLLEADHELGYRLLRALVRLLSRRLAAANDQVRAIMAMSMF